MGALLGEWGEPGSFRPLWGPQLLDESQYRGLDALESFEDSAVDCGGGGPELLLGEELPRDAADLRDAPQLVGTDHTASRLDALDRLRADAEVRGEFPNR